MAGGAVFCACQVVPGDGERQARRSNPRLDSSAWLRNPAIHAERSNSYLRPWYEASDTVDRS